MEDFKKEIENLRETLQSAEDERDKYAALCDKQHAEHSKQLESSSNRLQDRVRDLEEQLEDKERQLQDTINEIDTNSQAQLAELKRFYDGEKVRFEQRLADVKEQAQRRLTDTEGDYKNQLLSHQEEAEDIQGELNNEIAQLTDQL